jgi:hypothetical protein
MAPHDVEKPGSARRIVEKAEDTLDEHTRPEHPRKYADSDDAATVADLRREQQRETERQAMTPGPVGVLTEAQGHGFWRGGLAGAVIGALLLWPLGFIEWGGVALGWRMVSMSVIGAVAGAVVGGVYFAGRLPELEGELTGAHNQPADGTTLRDPATDDRGRRPRGGSRGAPG